MKNKQLSSEKTIQKIQKLRKIFLWAAVWILIVELVFGAILILMGAWETRGASSGADWFLSANKVQGTFLILAAILFVGVNNFVHIEKGSKTVRIFALLGFACNLIWAILAILLVWELIPFYWVETITKTFPHTGHSYSYNTYHTTFWVTTMLVFIYASLGCFCVSNIMSIAETVKLVKPLKITAVVCAIYLWAFETVVVIANLDYSKIGRLVLLSGLAGTALVMTALAANIISKTNQDKAPAAGAASADNRAGSSIAQKTDAELRAEIEEQVRREIIEKEVRAKMMTKEAEQNTIKSPKNDTPNSSPENGHEDTPRL